MPTTETLDRFIGRVEENAHAEALEESYTENASMQETKHPLGSDVMLRSPISAIFSPDCGRSPPSACGRRS